MRRTEPPPLATWILEHGIPGNYDEALAGDLLEQFRSGRSDAWFCRQVLAAWFLGWLKYLSMRRSLLIFSALWSALAPAWAAFVDNVDRFNADVSIGPLSRMFFLWVALNLAFIFAGMLLFVFIHSRIAGAFRIRELWRAFLLVPLIFAPVYFATFVMMNLFAYPGFFVDQGARTPLGELFDWTLRADALRVPYFLTLLWSMWGATPLMKSFSTAFFELKPAKLPTEASISAANAQPDSAPASYLDSYATKRFLLFVIGAGLLNALIAGFLLCRLPDSHSPSLYSLVARAIIYVATGALAGIAGIYLYWNSSASPFRAAAPIPFPLIAIASAAGWIWVPAMVLFAEQVSGITALVGGIGAFLLAAALRHVTSSAFAPTPRVPAPAVPADFAIFAESLYRPPREYYGYVIAICLYGAGWALATGWNYSACTLLALCAALFAWKRTFARSHELNPRREFQRAALRLAIVFLPAVLITIWALLDGVAHRNHAEAAALAAGNGAPSGDADKADAKTPPSATGISGYHSIILWPIAPKNEIVPPIPQPASFLAPGTTKPLVIQFTGPYYYFQPPHTAPTPAALQVKGTPLLHDFQTNNFMPLIMEAHQSLGASIPIARCREIQVGILNGDNRPGVINLAVLLTDSAQPNNQLLVGRQPIPSSLPQNFRGKSTPVPETLTFPIPTPSKIRRFDHITVMFFPDEVNYDQGSKVAIQQFQLVPR